MTTYFNYPSEELQQELAAIAKAIVAPGKGKHLSQKHVKFGPFNLASV